MRPQRLLGCGLVVTAALLGGCATDGGDKKLGHDDRVGGQAGLEQHIETGTTQSENPAARTGGQAGMEEHMEKGTAKPGESGGRVGGQAGEETPLEKR